MAERFIFIDTDTDLVAGDTAEFASGAEMTAAEAATALDRHIGRDPSRRFALLPNPGPDDIYVVWSVGAAFPIAKPGDTTTAIEEADDARTVELAGFVSVARGL